MMIQAQLNRKRQKMWMQKTEAWQSELHYVDTQLGFALKSLQDQKPLTDHGETLRDALDS
jgi:membrane-anchored protein YejM (alkaline phosphatase superfamily)